MLSCMVVNEVKFVLDMKVSMSYRPVGFSAEGYKIVWLSPTRPGVEVLA